MLIYLDPIQGHAAMIVSSLQGPLLFVSHAVDKINEVSQQISHTQVVSVG